MKNFQEHPQSLLLTRSIAPSLDASHADGRYAIGQDCGIDWRLTDPPEQGAEAPDWFYALDMPLLLLDSSHVSTLSLVRPIDLDDRPR